MSTANFETMKEFPLVCGGAYDEYREAYEKGFGEEPTDAEVYEEIQFDCEKMMEEANEFSDTLQYYTVEVADGYYDGWQFKVNTNEGLDLDPDSIWCIDNDDARYYFDKCRSQVMREAKVERNKINRWLNNKAKLDLMHKLVCVGVFSNGEAVYEEA